MMQLFQAMIKEEWRIHSSLFGGKMFALFPLIIGIGTGIATLFLPFFERVIPMSQFVLLSHYLFVLLGMGIGAFGLMGREVLNRRFGQASLIAYSSRSLPITERKLFFVFFAKDIFYYLLLWIVPIFFGITIGGILLGFSPLPILFLCVTLAFSFLIGLSLVFFFSTIYAHSSKILLFLLAVLMICSVVFVRFQNISFTQILPSYTLFYYPSLLLYVLVCGLIVLPITLSLLFLKVDYPERKRQYHNQFIPYLNRFHFSKYSMFLSKDFLDLKRSEGGLGKLVFQFLFPMILTWMFLYVFLEYIPGVSAVVMFSLFLGIVSMMVYNVLTDFDLFTAYAFLPVSVSMVLKSKRTSYLLINSISVIVLVFVAIGTSQYLLFIPAFLTFITISVFALAVTMYFTGLYPSLLLYNAKVMLQYSLVLGPLVFLFTFVAIFNPWYLLGSPILLLLARIFFQKSFKKWDDWQPLSF